ncbi:MAG TPA: lipoyl(octanoyl) transferase LipB [Phycisphaerae bacterium]|nr:lipoyl(octanoyl) transferase LipB [Phycisphaerae bacterium]
MKELIYTNLGRMPYAQVLKMQLGLVEKVKACPEGPAYMLLVEHDPPVITRGRRGGDENILASTELLKAKGIELHDTARGGDVTYHGPGQLVGYPIIRVDRKGRSVHGYIRDLEEVLIQLLARFDIKAKRVEGFTGVWVGEEKIAAIGVAVSRWVTYHGFALNVCPDLSHFGLIIPCGLKGKAVTSMAKILKKEITPEQLIEPLLECFHNVFGFETHTS